MLPSCTALLRSRAFALASLGVALVALGFSTMDERALSATSNFTRVDLDRDGLTDLQERVIGTLAYRRDTDNDGFSDLEERARTSDPLNAASIPAAGDYSIGACASQENGFVSVLACIYVAGTRLDTLDYDIGFVYRNKKVQASPSTMYTRAFLATPVDPRDTLVVVELGLPENLVRRLGQVSIWSRIRDTSAAALDPFVAVTTLVNFSGVIMSVEPTLMRTTNVGGSATGVVYRPLLPDDHIPSTWSGGQMCFQRTSAVGMSGISIIHEVDSAGCIPMDTYCSPDDCAAGVGQPLALPDPGALAGG